MRTFSLWLITAFLICIPVQAQDAEKTSSSSPKTTEEKAAPEQPLKKLADVRVPGVPRVPIDEEHGWTTIPKSLIGGEIHSPVVSTDRHLEFTVESDGAVLMTVTWQSTSTNVAQPSQDKTFRSFPDLIDEGWIWVGFLRFQKSEAYYLFQKDFKKGETLRIHTNPVTPPFVVIPTPQGFDEIATTNSTSMRPRHKTTYLGAPSSRGADEFNVLSLNTHHNYMTNEQVNHSLLANELVRQAILISARDELQVLTRDETLRETPLKKRSANNLSLNVLSTIIPGHQFHILLFRRLNDKHEIYLDQAYPLPGPKHRYLDALSAQLERLSRTDIVEALRDAGFAGERHTTNQSTAIPQKVEQLLLDMSIISQFSALRQLHQIIRDQGESPQLLGGLAMAYANLGLLTEANLNAAHKAFKARALLYAERLVVADPKSANAHWIRAYVNTLGERYGYALEEIVRAEKLDPDEKQTPPWGEILKAICVHDERMLEKIIDHPTHAALAGLLRMKGPDHGRPDLQMQDGARVLGLVPDCETALATMFFAGDETVQQKLSRLAPVTVAMNLYPRLLAIPGLPKAAAEIANRNRDFQTDDLDLEGNLGQELKDRLELARVLYSAEQMEGDSSDLSWGILGQLILEVSFRQAWQRLYYDYSIEGQPHTETGQRLYDLFIDSPRRKLLLAYSGKAKTRASSIHAIRIDESFRELEYTKRRILRGVRKSSIYKRALGVARSHIDESFGDVQSRFETIHINFKGLWARRLLRTAPQHPYAVAMAVRHDWTTVADRWQDAETRYASVPIVQRELGVRLTNLKQYDDAERCLKRYLELQPEKDSYTTLAELYKAQGDEAQWLATLEALSETQQWHERDRTLVMIAEHLMKQQKWKQAQHYAYEAAENEETWSLLCARDCAEGLGDLDTAEQYVRSISENHPGCEMTWYIWCKRLDFGDLEAARDLAFSRLQSIEKPGRKHWFDIYGTFHLLEGELEASLEPIQKAFAGNNNPYSGLHLAILADECGQPELRDKTLREVLKVGPRFQYYNRRRIEMLQFATMLLKAYSANNKESFDLERIEEILKDAPDSERTNVDYYVGRYLLKHGRVEDAVKYLKRSARASNHQLNRAFAAVLLHERGIDYRSTDQE